MRDNGGVSVYRDDGIVLRTHKLGEADRIVTLLTRRTGRVRAVAKGARLKEVGTQARRQIEALLGTRVYLDLRIKIAKDWQRDPKQLRRLGFYD